MSETERRQRALARRARITVHVGRLGRTELDLDPIRGEAAVSLVAALTRESWSEAGYETPVYDRSAIPVRFVPRRHA